MILSDREIIVALARGAVRITGNPEKDASKWSSTALDLTLAPSLEVWRRIDGADAQSHIDPMDAEFNVATMAANHAEKASCAAPNGYIVEPGTFLLGWTVEKIQFPHTSRIAARVEGKSSLARIGIGVHVTAPTIHAGFGYREDDQTFPGNPIQLERVMNSN
jgi:dCTP deaminase